MAGLSISPPGVEVIQEFVSTSPTAIIPFLPTVYVGPCFQVVSAFDDLGNPQDEAYAGTYRDGLGRIDYALPSLVTEASLVGFEDEIRVFLVTGSTRELYSVNDEEPIVEGGTGATFTLSTLYFEDLSQLFSQIGVEAGDVIRITYRGEPLDLLIDTIISDTVLEVASAGPITEASLSALAYDIVRHPAEFVFDAVQQANVELGTEADYIRFTAALLKADGVTDGDYLGSAGDDLSVYITDSDHYADGDLGVVGDSIFSSATGDFTTSVPATAYVPDTTTYAHIGTIAATPNGLVFREVLYVTSDNYLAIESGEGALAGQAWVVGEEVQTAADGQVATGTTFTSATATFPAPTAGYGNAPDSPYFVEIEGDGVYDVATVDSATQLTLATAATNATGLTYTVIEEVSSGADGVTRADTFFMDVEGGLAGLTTSQSINIGGTLAQPIATATDLPYLVDTTGATFADGVDQSFSAVDTTSALALTWDPDVKQIRVNLERTAGITGSTYAEINTAIMSDLDPSYNVNVTDVINSSLGAVGATTILEASLPIDLQLDGGSDDSSLLLDADLLGSSTPTGLVYVSYKALRVDVTANSTSFDGAIYIENDDQREALLGAATIDNPLSLAVAFGLVNSPTQGVYALGVDVVNAAKPYGTSEAYADAFDALEPEDIHLIEPLTMDLVVAQLLQVHVDAMSESDQKAERIGFFNSELPEYANAEVIASGTEGNNTAAFLGNASAEFSTSVDLVAAGVADGDILVVTALSGADTELEAVDGTVGPLYGLALSAPFTKAGDDFIAICDASGLTDTDWIGGAGGTGLVDVNWTIYRPGAAISARTSQAEAIAETSEGFEDRRMYHHWPDEVTADVEGTEFLLPGFYLAAGWAGKANEEVPERGFSNDTVAGYTGLNHSNGFFSKAQLDRIAGGGTWITIQESQNAPLKCRHQLSTDTSSIEKREFSITRVVDYTAKYLRLGLQRQVGRFNITKSYLDALSTTVQGLLLGLEEAGKLVSASLVSLDVNETQPDKIDIVVAIQVPFPANYIEITLQI